MGLWCFKDGLESMAEVAMVLAETKGFMSRSL